MGTEVLDPRDELLSVEEIAERINSLAKEDQGKRTWLVAMGAVGQNDLVYEQATDALYIKPPTALYYRRLSDYEQNKLAIQHALQFGQPFLPKQISDTIRLIKLNAPTVERVDSNCIMISEHLFWDKTKGELALAPTGRIFKRLFDTSVETEKIVKVAPFTEQQEQRLIGMYEQVKAELEEHKEVERFEPLKVWANGSHDVYVDLHRAHAACFLKKKPLGVYLFTGLRRNGKSTFIYMTHSMLGTNNTSMVKLTEIGNVRKNLRLIGTLFNGSDDEDDKTIPEQGMFKTLADHGILELEVMYSQEPKMLECDFMCFFPMNHTPEWQGAGAAACMNRSLIIPFTAVLEGSDDGKDNYMKRTFTADFMCEYVGSVLAYAHYYHRHDFVKSNTMKNEQQILQSETESAFTYMDLFVKYFYGFDNWNFLYDDYFKWCVEEDVKPQKLKDLKTVARKKMKNLQKRSARINQVTRKIYIADKTMERLDLFLPSTERNEFHKTIAEMHGHPADGQAVDASVIEELDIYWSGKKDEFSRRLI